MIVLHSSILWSVWQPLDGKKIVNEFKVLVKGKQHLIKFKEVEDIKVFLEGKSNPMNVDSDVILNKMESKVGSKETYSSR